MSAGRWGVVIALAAGLVFAGGAVFYLKRRPAAPAASSVSGHATLVEPSEAPPAPPAIPATEPPAATPAPSAPRAAATPSGRPRVVADVPAAKEVKLDEAVDVVHRHGVGSCQGRLVATAAGLRYETDRREDAFTKTFAEVEPLELDYSKKNLRVKVYGGKTYNFTTKAPNADDLRKFQQVVEAARKGI